MTINDASNIEIVRGPNSALYGRTAIGGSVNVRTSDPTATPEFGVDLTGGQLGTANRTIHRGWGALRPARAAGGVACLRACHLVACGCQIWRDC